MGIFIKNTSFLRRADSDGNTLVFRNQNVSGRVVTFYMVFWFQALMSENFVDGAAKGVVSY